jgi:hypothetical protein
MIEIILGNLVTNFYPKGICAMSDNSAYVNSFEFKNLIAKINTAFKLIEESKLNIQILNELKSNDALKDIEEVTLESSDRCISFKLSFFEGDILYQLYLNLSVIVPYYYIYVLKNNFESEPYRWINLPVRDKESEKIKFDSEIKLISSIIESKTMYNRFPDELIKTIIPDINYADVELGTFTYFNAFFLDDVNL